MFGFVCLVSCVWCLVGLPCVLVACVWYLMFDVVGLVCVWYHVYCADPEV